MSDGSPRIGFYPRASFKILQMTRKKFDLLGGKSNTKVRLTSTVLHFSPAQQLNYFCIIGFDSFSEINSSASMSSSITSCPRGLVFVFSTFEPRCWNPVNNQRLSRDAWWLPENLIHPPEGIWAPNLPRVWRWQFWLTCSRIKLGLTFVPLTHTCALGWAAVRSSRTLVRGNNEGAKAIFCVSLIERKISLF